ncbi:MAG TPA: hypothetical protein PKD00_01415 [Burkholderiales bacterium]|nr:hypothetical protein [Burkholderiales bacterium]
MRIKVIKTYALSGEIEITDEYKVIIFNHKNLNNYIKENYDEPITLEELIDTEIDKISLDKNYFNNSVKFTYINSSYDDDFTNNVKDLLKETYEIVGD